MNYKNGRKIGQRLASVLRDAQRLAATLERQRRELRAYAHGIRAGMNGAK